MKLDEFIEKLTEDEREQLEELRLRGASGDKAARDELSRFIDDAVSRILGADTGRVAGLLKGELFGGGKGTSRATAQPSATPFADLARQLPYPLGVRLEMLADDVERRAGGAPVPQLPYDICAAAGVLARLAAVIAISAYVRGAGATDIALNTLVHARLREPTDGGWLELVARLSKTVEPGSAATLAGTLKAAWEAPVGTGKHARGVGVALGRVVEFRNKLLHGERPDEAAVNAAWHALEDAVRGVAFLADWELIVRDGPDGIRFRRGVAEPAAKLNPSLPLREVCLAHRRSEMPWLSLSPLVKVGGPPERPVVEVEDLLFLNAGSLDRIEYIAYRHNQTFDGKAIGSYDEFREFMKRMQAPPIPPEPRIDFSATAEYHERLFVGREAPLAEIEKFVVDRPCSYGIVKARAGMGKTALLARLWSMHAASSKPDASSPLVAGRSVWVFHFCMSTDARNNATVVLRSLTAQVCDALQIDRANYLANDLKKLKESHFPALLKTAATMLGPEGRLVLLVDALDEGIGADRDSVPSVLPPNLPDGVVGILSYRVYENARNTRVEKELKHIIDAGQVCPIKAADPLQGLLRDDVEAFLDKAVAVAKGGYAGLVPARTVDAVWKAATREALEADPFYLRFVAEALANGQADVRRAETIPDSLEDAFEELWMALPTTQSFLIHRVLLTLAIMREHGDDELLAELFNREAKDHEDRIRPDDIAALRLDVGKLLVYDGPRYGLFHDRFRHFLVGEQTDPIAEAFEQGSPGL
jgi:hypothetical protein